MQIPLLVQMFSPSDVIYFQIHKIIHLLYFEIIKLKIWINYRCNDFEHDFWKPDRTSAHTHTHTFINIFMNILLRSSKILVSLHTLTATPSPCYLSLSSVPAHPIRDGKMLLPCPNVLHIVTIPNCKRWCNTFTTYMLWFEL